MKLAFSPLDVKGSLAHHSVLSLSVASSGKEKVGQYSSLNHRNPVCSFGLQEALIPRMLSSFCLVQPAGAGGLELLSSLLFEAMVCVVPNLLK